MRLNVIALLLAGLAAAQTQQPPAPQTKQQRDLKVESIDDPGAPPKNVSIPRSYAVIVGISRYQNLPEKLQLQFAERDAQSIYTILISPEGGNFTQENVHILAGAKATLAGLKREIDGWLPSVAKEGDRVLIYFAGHGFLYQGKGYLAPYDFNMDKIGATGYPMDELGSVIGSKIHATSKILLTDACHSGAITPEETADLNGKLSSLNKSLFSLTASRAQERSFESPELEGGHGVFTYFVVKGMEGYADVSHDGIVTADELAEYVHTEVRQATDGQQNPTSDKTNFDANMLLAYTPANAKPASAPQPKFGSLVFESNMDDVEVFVDGKTIGVVSKGKPLSVPGLSPGQHTVKGVKAGYEPDGPRQEPVYPGTPRTVSIKILIQRHRAKAAVDDMDKGMEYYLKGGEPNYRKAADLFGQALHLDGTYSLAALYLGRTYNALFEEEKAQEYYKKAIETDPDYLEARAAYAGMLLDIGDVDESIRQINAVLQRQPNHVLALTMLAQADRLKAIYPDSIEAGRKAVKLSPTVGEPHLWIGDSLRLSGKYGDAKTEYEQYLKLSNDSGLSGQLNYYILGSLFGMGKKTHSAEHDIWQELRSLAYFGICDCEYHLKNFDLAIGYCQKSLSYYSKDPYAHYALGLSYMHKAQQDNRVGDLGPALRHFQQMLTINPDLDEAKIAKQNIGIIKQALNQ